MQATASGGGPARSAWFLQAARHIPPAEVEPLAANGCSVQGFPHKARCCHDVTSDGAIPQGDREARGVSSRASTCRPSGRTPATLSEERPPDQGSPEARRRWAGANSRTSES